jgi:hypothetical protein
MYRAPHKLEQEGWISADWISADWISAEWIVSETKRRVKFYSLKKDGRKQLHAQTADWRLLAGLLYGVTPLDAITLGGVTFTLGLVAVLAGFLPARRATRVDPALALRYE